jgi:hypothetical protein
MWVSAGETIVVPTGTELRVHGTDATPSTTPAAATGNGHGPGSPGDATSAFVEALDEAVRRQLAGTADERVASAVALGWYLGALAHPGDPMQTAAAVRGQAVRVGGLTERQLMDYCHSQVQVAFAKLRKLVEAAGLSLPDLQELGDCIDAAQAAARRKAASAVDGKVIAVLSAADFRLGKAYGVGRALMDLTTAPAPDATIAGHLTAARIAPVAAAIDDLGTALPAHAGHSVRASLLEWQVSVEDGSTVAPDTPETWMLLARQGELWRALLAGEKSGRDMLEVDDYVDAADRLSRRVRQLVFRVARRMPELLAGVIALFAIGIVLIALTDSAAAIAAGAGTILASLGLTWRGVGRLLGGLTAKLERPLWGAELDVAITEAITLLPREAGRDVTEARRGVAIALGAPPGAT